MKLIKHCLNCVYSLKMGRLEDKTAYCIRTLYLYRSCSLNEAFYVFAAAYLRMGKLLLQCKLLPIKTSTYILLL